MNQRAAQLTEARGRIEELIHQQETSTEDAARSEELIALERERDELQDALGELKSKVAANTAAQDEGALKDLRRRFELAVESVRSLKSRNEALTEQINDLREAAEANPSAGSETPRVKSPSEQEAESKQAAEATLVADRLLAQKDKKIGQLEAMVKSLHHNVEQLQNRPTPDQTEGAAPLSADEFQRVQQEWLEKQRSSEVEIAVERAHNARIRSELEEKMRDVEAQLALARKKSNITPSAPPRSKGWLGLRRNEE